MIVPQPPPTTTTAADLHAAAPAPTAAATTTISDVYSSSVSPLCGTTRFRLLYFVLLCVAMTGAYYYSFSFLSFRIWEGKQAKRN